MADDEVDHGKRQRTQRESMSVIVLHMKVDRIIPDHLKTFSIWDQRQDGRVPVIVGLSAGGMDRRIRGPSAQKLMLRIFGVATFHSVLSDLVTGHVPLDIVWTTVNDSFTCDDDSDVGPRSDMLLWFCKIIDQDSKSKVIVIDITQWYAWSGMLLIDFPILEKSKVKRDVERKRAVQDFVSYIEEIKGEVPDHLYMTLYEHAKRVYLA